MLKNKRLIIIVAIILVVVLICAVIGFLFIKKSKNRDINYINAAEGVDSKLAFIINGNKENYVLALDEKEIAKYDVQYFGNNEKNIDSMFEITQNASDSVYVKNDNIEIEVEVQNIFNEDSEIIKTDGRWIMFKDDTVARNDVEYTIYYYTDEQINKLNEETNFLNDIIHVKTIYDVKEEKAIKEFDNIKSKINFYKMKEIDGIISFKDFDSNDVYLSEYNFARDLIVKSLFDYDIYIRNAIGIKENIYEREILYSVPGDLNKTQYAIDTCDLEYIEENKENAAVAIDYVLEYNDRKYEVVTTELGGGLNFYTQINEDTYIRIFMNADDIEFQTIESNIEVFVERIKEHLL